MSQSIIPYGRQSIDESDIEAVLSVLKSDFLTTGPTIEKFEKLVAQYCGAKEAVAVANATAALHLAARAIDVGPGDEVWTSPITFVASANCAEHCGANANFVDIDEETINLSVQALEKKLSLSKKSPKALVPVHFAGQPCDLKSIYKLKEKHGFKVIEDAAHAIGSEYENKKIGDCRYSDMTVFSFHPVKNITTAEGGMITTNDSKLAERLRELRSIGITRNPARMSKKPDGPWYYEQREFGFNYRMTDIEAALGISQISRLDGFVKRRNEIFKTYSEELRNLPLKLPELKTGNLSAWHLYVIQLTDRAPLTRGELFAKLKEAGIGVNVHYIPVHLQPVYQKKGFKSGDYPTAEDYYSRAVSLPIFVDLSQKQQHFIIERLQKLLA